MIYKVVAGKGRRKSGVMHARRVRALGALRGVPRRELPGSASRRRAVTTACSLRRVESRAPAGARIRRAPRPAACAASAGVAQVARPRAG
ncbi:MAG: hypothetical protein MZU91_08455 [Desulfosudis oleivorans]|nr:hypothetical protein [Desulfosudis oleivorans]